jgi:DNA polymerase-1
MDGLLATTEMEWNGMYVHAQRGAVLREEVSSNLDSATKELEQFIPVLPDGMTFNWNSNVHKSCLIFGGTAKYDKWKAHEPTAYSQKTVAFPKFNNEPVNPDECKLAGAVYVKPCVSCTAGRVIRKGNIFYLVQDTFLGGQKIGQPKFKNEQVDDLTKMKGAIVDHYHTFEGFTKPNKKWIGAKTDAYDEPLYSVGADVVEELAKRKVPFTDALSKQTSLSKDLGTYYWAIDKKGVKKGMLTLVNGNGIIHHSLHHVKTVTSRMSASDPNMQNIPRAGTSKIKQVFTSRFGTLGRMAEIDYSQLEVVIQGVLTEDKQLCQDLRDRVDFHCKRLATKEGLKYEDVLSWCKGEEIPEWVDKRTKAKVFSFQRAYGAGVNTIVESTGMSKNDVEALIEAENVLYPDVLKFDQRLEKHILDNRVRVEDRKLFFNGLAFNQYEGHWDSPTGTRYVWREHITPEFMHKKGKFTGFSPTERKNYPMQGFGGEIMQTMLGKVWRYFLENDYFNGDVLLVNTVHDCLLLDGQSEDLLRPVAEQVHKILETVPEVFNKAFPDTLNITVPFPVETEIGHDLFDMNVVHF